MLIFEVADEDVYFENTQLLATGQWLGFLPDRMEMAAITQQPEGHYLAEIGRGKLDDHYLACANYTAQQVCNWMVRADDPEGNGYCLACRLNSIIPNLEENPENVHRWAKVEAAKRRLIYTLLRLGLPVRSGLIEPGTGLSFQFLADTAVTQSSGPGGQIQSQTAGPRILTGHENGIITLNIEEADDSIREQTRRAMGEKYRTLLGHFRHESGHYYWERLIQDTQLQERCRELFGDDTLDYGTALQNHYNQGPPPDWQNRFITAYAASHPWEDWAESWAHYLYVVDAVELAQQQGLVRGLMEVEASPRIKFRTDFGAVLEAWTDLSVLLNSFNRTAGISDPYPFILSKLAMEKMVFVHEAVMSVSEEGQG